MHDAFKTSGPTCISFSGGRTSAYLLWRVLQAHGGTLPDDAQVLFCNTGKEEEATLRFVRECGERWNVQIVWLEYTGNGEWVECDFDSAARSAKPLRWGRLAENFPPLPNAKRPAGGAVFIGGGAIRSRTGLDGFAIQRHHYRSTA